MISIVIATSCACDLDHVLSLKEMEDTVPTMSVGDFAAFLSEKFDEDVVEVMKKNKIAGATFLKLSERQMENMVSAVGDVVELKELQARITSLSEQVRT